MSKKYWSLFFFQCLFQLTLLGEPYPIGFSIPEVKVVSNIPKKTQDFAFIIPGNLSTYIYESEADYYQDYQKSYFAITCCKAGWDCLRHYEILANGCIPYFVDLDLCDESTLYFLPKELIKEAMNLEGVSYMHIDHEKFDQKKYYKILEKLLTHTREHLTTKQMASYMMETVGYSGDKNILFLSQNPAPDYMRCLILTGLKEIFGTRVIDVPKIEHIYKSYDGNIKNLYGKGMTYTRIIEDLFVDREQIEQRILNKEFDLIIYGSVHRGNPFHDLVLNTYEPEQIIYLCGEDIHTCQYTDLQNLFLREFGDFPKR